jgi:pilus assembly protein CpaB
MNRRRVVTITCAVIVAGVGATGLVSWANSSKSSAEDRQAQTSVVIIDKHVPKGSDAATILADSHEATVAQKDLAPGAITRDAQVGTQIALADLEPGDQLVQARIGTKTSDLPTGTIEMSIKLEAERAVGGVLQSGSLVDVYISTDADKGATPPVPAATALAFTKVKVTNSQTAATTTDEKGAVKASQFIVTLALTADQQKLVAGAEFGHVWLVLEPTA